MANTPVRELGEVDGDRGELCEFARTCRRQPAAQQEDSRVGLGRPVCQGAGAGAGPVMTRRWFGSARCHPRWMNRCRRRPRTMLSGPVDTAHGRRDEHAGPRSSG